VGLAQHVFFFHSLLFVISMLTPFILMSSFMSIHLFLGRPLLRCSSQFDHKNKKPRLLRKIHRTNFFHIKFLDHPNIKCQNGPVLPPAQFFLLSMVTLYITWGNAYDVQNVHHITNCAHADILCAADSLVQKVRGLHNTVINT
jgi:hypothetical protein